MGIDQIALDLLEDQEQHDEEQRLPGIGDSDQQRPHAAADERAHNGDQGGQGDQNAHQQGIGQAEEGHGDHKQRAQDDGLQTLAGEKAGEGPVGEPQDLQRPVRPAEGEEGIEDLPDLTAELLLLHQQVEGEDQADDKGAHAADHAADQAAAGGHQTGAQVFGKLHGGCIPVVPGQLELQLCERLLQQGQIGGQGLQLLPAPVQRRRDLADDGHDRVGHAGADDAGGQGQNAQDRHQRQHQGQRAAETAALAAVGEEVAFNGPHRYVEHKGNGAAQQEGGQNP